jgi:hypothetical protein
MARRTRTHTRTRTKTRKHRRGNKHIKSCKCKYCAKKVSRTRARRGGTQTAIGGDMIYKGGQWYSYNSVGGRS